MKKFYRELNKIFYLLLVIGIIVPLQLKADSWADIYATNPNVSGCQRGEITETQRQIILSEVNKIRAIHKLAPAMYNKSDEPKTQQGALMCCANGAINHTPPSSWHCYTADGRNGTENSNLYASWGMGGSNLSSSVNSIIAWMIDANTPELGHRQAIINPFVKNISFGRVDGNPKDQPATFFSAMALQYRSGYNTSIDVDYIACPFENYPPKYFDKNWLLSFSAFYDKNNWWNNGAIDIANVKIEVKAEGSSTSLSVSNIAFDNQGWGSVMNCLKWKVAGLQNETKYNVTIKNLKVNGVAKDYEYWFRLTDQGSTEDPPYPPALSAPANASVNVVPPVKFSWNSSVGADSYHLQISKSASFSSLVYEDDEMTGVSYDLPEIDENTTYYWRVSASNKIGTSAWSATWNFTSKESFPKPPDPPSLSAPANNAVDVDTNVTLAWKDNMQDAYQIQLATDPEFENLVKNNKTYDASFKVKNLRTGIYYYWRIASIDNTMGQGKWSDTWKFKTFGQNSVQEAIADDNSFYCFPNPFNHNATINYKAYKTGRIRIEVYNVAGEKVAVLADYIHNPGEYSVDFNAESIPAGVYYYRYISPTANISKMMQVVK